MHLKHRRNPTVVLLLCTVLLTACAGCSLPVRRLHLPLPEQPDVYIRDMLQYATLPDAITFLSLVTVSSDRGVLKSKSVIKLKLPDKIRIETLGFMGHPAAITTSDGKTITVTLLTEQRQYTGAADTESIAKIFGVAMPLRNIPYIILGTPMFDPSGFVCAQENSLFCCRSATYNATATLRINPEHRTLLHYDYVSEGIPARYSVSYGEFKKTAGRMLPHRIIITSPDMGKTITIRHLTVSNESNNDDFFHQRLFPGSALLPLEALQELW